jgi:hypothetical protein
VALAASTVIPGRLADPLVGEVVAPEASTVR